LGDKILRIILKSGVILNPHQKSGGGRQNILIGEVSLYHMILISGFYYLRHSGHFQEESSAARIKVLPFRDHVTYSCIWPEIPVKRAHCSAVVLYGFFAILAKSQFCISINNPIKINCIYPQFHWAVYLGMLYPEIELVLPSYTCVLWKTLICGTLDRVKIVIQPPFPPFKAREA
jgi:hypothetical protein